ncbi:MAG: hypothetical protein BAJALOKI1v1_150026 [Promethearchaeota archaeon]|nr:MAG: hypothetical protein BAJALOKI1v1_150026 [Candidatus Lokiarchaeota archaeon]
MNNNNNNNNKKNGEHILILNIGGSPIPNYVVALFSLIIEWKITYEQNHENRKPIINCLESCRNHIPRPTKIILIHSTQTEVIAENIRDKLIQDNRTSNLGFNHFILINIHNNQRNFSALNQNHKLLTELEQTPNISSIHFNYTGATKSMMLSGYSQCKELSEAMEEDEQHFKLILSDLTPRTFFLKLLIEEFPNGQVFSIELPEPIQNNILNDLRDLITLSLEDILELHSIEITNINLDHNYLYRTDKIIELIEIKLFDYHIPLNWQIHMERLIDQFENPQNLNVEIPILTQIRNLLNLLVNTNIEYTIPLLINGFDNAEDLLIENEVMENLMEDDEFRERLWELTELITGRFFEDYIYEIIKERNLEISVLSYIYKNVDAETLNRRPMEFDVVIIKGYQLFIVSVTTSVDPELVKEKAFEVHHRAIQIGGDGAKGIVISLLDHLQDNEAEEERVIVSHLNDDFKKLIGQGKLKIYGRNIINTNNLNALEGDLVDPIMQNISTHITLKNTEAREVEINSDEKEDILILNIGRNPLPNYIIARCAIWEFDNAQQDLIKNLPRPTRIIIIHSNKTTNFAHHIEDVLSNMGNLNQLLPQNAFIYLNIGNFHRNLDYINNHLLALLNQFNSINSLHFGYMGGTKPMALGVYRTINNFIQNQNIPTLMYSDVDSDFFQVNIKLINNNGEYALIFPIANNQNTNQTLRNLINLPTDDVIYLYNFTVNNLPAVQPNPINLVDNNNNNLFIDNQTIENLIKNAGFDPNTINLITDRKFGHQISPIRFLFSIGYQLFLITFSTAEKIGAIKKDAFEAKYLSEILGGEYAIGILLIQQNLNHNQFAALREDLAEFQAKKTCIILDGTHINLLTQVIENGNTMNAWNNLV